MNYEEDTDRLKHAIEIMCLTLEFVQKITDFDSI